jgi:acyl-coenzyme A thioesterase PaaI-like protein
MHLPTLLSKARHSAFRRWWLRHALDLVIPFNRPHGFRVVPLPEGGIEVQVPYRRVNLNHIKGIHACALATASEMCSGLSVLEHLDPQRYRLIMRSMRMDYHYQAKTRARARCMPDPAALRREVIEPLAKGQAVDHTSVVEVHDAAGRHVCTGTITWQVKAWEHVRTKV